MLELKYGNSKVDIDLSKAKSVKVLNENPMDEITDLKSEFIKGVTTKVDVDNENDYKITYTYDLKQLSDSDITSLGINKDYTTLKNNYTSRGLTCK